MVQPTIPMLADLSAEDAPRRLPRAPLSSLRLLPSDVTSPSEPNPSSGQAELSLYAPEASLELAHRHRLALLALASIPGVGEVSLRALTDQYGNLDSVWSAAPGQLLEVLTTSGVKTARRIVDQISSRGRFYQESAIREFEKLRSQAITVVTLLDSGYPGRLREIDDPPRWLFVHGNVELLSAPNLVAVVGTRDASTQGVKRTRRLCSWLAERRFGIISGLAEGIDQAAHQTAVDFAVPTIAVLGHGTNTIFPACSARLRQEIVAEGGAVVSEYFPAETYSRIRFVQRNRIQAGLSCATVPVEARIRSGTAHTYRFARQYRRMIFGVRESKTPAPNELLELLQSDGYPIFDLDTPASMRKLEAMLRPATNSAAGLGSGQLAYQRLLREFDRLLSSYEISKKDVRNLKSQLEEMWAERQKRE